MTLQPPGGVPKVRRRDILANKLARMSGNVTASSPMDTFRFHLKVYSKAVEQRKQHVCSSSQSSAAFTPPPLLTSQSSSAVPSGVAHHPLGMSSSSASGLGVSDKLLLREIEALEGISGLLLGPSMVGQQESSYIKAAKAMQEFWMVALEALSMYHSPLGADAPLNSLLLRSILLVIDRPEIGFLVQNQEFLNTSFRSLSDAVGFSSGPPPPAELDFKDKEKLCRRSYELLMSTLAMIKEHLGRLPNDHSAPNLDTLFMDFSIQVLTVSLIFVPFTHRLLEPALKSLAERVPLEAGEEAQFEAQFEGIRSSGSPSALFQGLHSKSELIVQLERDIFNRSAHWLDVLFHRDVFYFLLLEKMLRRISPVDEHGRPQGFYPIPAYLSMLKPFLRRLFALPSTRYTQNIVHTTHTLLADRALFSPFVHFLFSKTNVLDKTSTLKTLELLACWFRILARAGEALPASFDFAFFLPALALLLQSEIFLISVETLHFIYQFIDVFRPPQRLAIAKTLLEPAHFFKFFLHWDYIVRMVFHHILLYKLVPFAHLVALFDLRTTDDSAHLKLYTSCQLRIDALHRQCEDDIVAQLIRRDPLSPIPALAPEAPSPGSHHRRGRSTSHRKPSSHKRVYHPSLAVYCQLSLSMFFKTEVSFKTWMSGRSREPVYVSNPLAIDFPSLNTNHGRTAEEQFEKSGLGSSSPSAAHPSSSTAPSSPSHSSTDPLTPDSPNNPRASKFFRKKPGSDLEDSKKKSKRVGALWGKISRSNDEN
ncbi:MAG: DUF1765 domain-containing protein [archaeon]|nr:DUF1765 domain-containing protein [archaeon]